MLPSSVTHRDSCNHVPVMSPTPVTLSQPSKPAGSHQMRPLRPKLTVNTVLEASKSRTFGKGSSLSLDTLSAVSPTAKNTFANAYPLIVQTPTNHRPELSIEPVIGQRQVFSTPSELGSSRTPSYSSVSSTPNTAFVQHAKHLYTQPEGIASILVTSRAHRSNLVTMSKENRPGLAAKRVSFREPLEEEIKTLRYLLAHSDIKSTESVDSGSLDATSTTTTLSEPSNVSMHEQPTFDFHVSSNPTSDSRFLSPSPSTFTKAKSKHGTMRSVPRRNSSPPVSNRQKRDSSSEDDSDDMIVPQTPVAGRCKKQRQWTWTLDPLPGQKSQIKSDFNDGNVVLIDDDSVSTSSRFSESSAG